MDPEERRERNRFCERQLRARWTPEQIKAKRDYMSRWHAAHLGQRKRQYRYDKELHRALKLEVYMAYGGVRCSCCGETGEKFLTLDHVNEDGWGHRKALRTNSTVAVYNWAKKNSFPPGLQVLCYNCNFAKARNGGVCPHKQTFEDYDGEAIYG